MFDRAFGLPQDTKHVQTPILLRNSHPLEPSCGDTVTPVRFRRGLALRMLRVTKDADVAGHQR